MGLTEQTKPVVELFQKNEEGPETRLVLDEEGLEKILADYIPNCGYGIFGRAHDPFEPESAAEGAKSYAKSVFAAIAYHQSHHEHAD